MREERPVGVLLSLLLPTCDAALAEQAARQTLASGQPISLSLEAGSAGTQERWTWLVCPLAKPGESPQLLLIGTATTPCAAAQRENALPARKELFAQLVHELRGPLAPIRAALSLLRSAEPEILERVRAILDRQVDSLSRLIHDLYELARGERAQLTLLRDRVNVDALVERALELARPILQARRHSLTVDVEPGLWIDADPGRLVQVLANLLINAAKYTDIGGMVWLEARMASKELVVCVRDNGIGIGADVLPHVFDAFVRSSRARSREQDGSGLGLSVVRAIVQQHDGVVEVHSDGPDRGSAFTVRLPAAAPSAARAQPGATSSENPVTPQPGIHMELARGE